MVPDSVLTAEDSAVMVTSDENRPATILMTRFSTLAVSTFASSTTVFLKPGASTVTLCVTGSGAVTTKELSVLRRMKLLKIGYQVENLVSSA